MTPEEIEQARKRKTQLEIESHGGKASSDLPPPPPTSAKPPGGGAGTPYGPGVSVPANYPGPMPPPPPIQPYTSDSSADQLRPEDRRGGGYAGTGLEDEILSATCFTPDDRDDPS